MAAESSTAGSAWRRGRDSSLEHVVMVPSDWARLLAEPAELTFERVPFDHPLWVLYSSGTTGLPKAIVQGHGGIPALEHLKKANSTRTWRRTTASSGLRPPGG